MQICSKCTISVCNCNPRKKDIWNPPPTNKRWKEAGRRLRVVQLWLLEINGEKENGLSIRFIEKRAKIINRILPVIPAPMVIAGASVRLVQIKLNRVTPKWWPSPLFFFLFSNISTWCTVPIPLRSVMYLYALSKLLVPFCFLLLCLKYSPVQVALRRSVPPID